MKYKKGDILYLKYDDNRWDVVKLLSDIYAIYNDWNIRWDKVEIIKSSWVESGVNYEWFIKNNEMIPYKCSPLLKLLHGINI